jgi:5'-methylthioadenosine phosphorylase
LKARARIGIIGGSGFYSLLDRPERIVLDTPYGKPSSGISVGRMAGKEVAFLSRHGERHTLAPHSIPYKANIEALRELGVERLITTNAVGSLAAEYEPGDIVFFDQFVNMTHGRADTFYDSGKVVHISTAEPYCPELREIAIGCARKLGLKHHERGTVVVVNGPRFSTKAESRFFASHGFQLINMTQYPELALARERELCYLGIGLVTDYDAGLEGRPEIGHVTTDELNRTFASKIGDLKRLLPEIVAKVPEKRGTCSCGEALKGAVMSQ